MTAPDRVWVFGELEGWHNTGHGRARDFNRYPLDDRERATGAEYVRADLVQELVEALEVFSDACKYIDHAHDDDYAPAWAEFFEVGQFRRARAALAKLNEAGS